MIKHLILLLLFIGLAFAENIVVAVFDFENNGLNDAQVRQIRSRLESELEKAGGLAIVERKQINEVIEEQKLQMSGIIGDDDLVEIGSILGATHILSGSVGKMDATYHTISAKLVNTASGQVEQTSSYDAEKGLPDLMKNGLKSLARDLVKIEMEISGDLQFKFSIGKIFIDDRDFNRSGFGSPLNIGIAVWEDRNIIERINVGKVRGLEGVNRTLPIELKINSVYKLFIGETNAIIKVPKVYEWNATWEGVDKAKTDDEWFFNKGKLKIGSKSYIEVIQTPSFPVDETKYPIYRFLHKTLNDHFYTTNSNPKGKWEAEGIEFLAYKEQVEGTIPIYRYLHKSYKDHFYSKNENPKGNWKHQGIEFYAYPTQVDGTVAIYRYHSKGNQDHFYTTSSTAYSDYVSQGIEFYAFPVDNK